MRPLARRRGAAGRGCKLGLLALAACCVAVAAVSDERSRPQKFPKSRSGMVAASTPYATEAAVRILNAGGNAIDAAAAAHFALMVTDPANTSLGGRAQILLSLRDGRVVAIDGATQAPARIRPLAGPQEQREGYAIVPVPGAPAALAEMVSKYGRLKLTDILQPAIELAENGFAVTPRLALTWARAAPVLAKNPGASENFLKPDGSVYRAGEIFRQPRLARVLRRIASSSVEIFYRGTIADTIARDMASSGGFVRKQDLANYRALSGVVVRATYRGYEVSAAGGRAWGDTLAEMVNILDQFPIGSGSPTAEEIEVVAWTMAQALEDRPQEIGSLKPKKGGYPLHVISSRRFSEDRAELIRTRLRSTGLRQGPGRDKETEGGDTTHLSVMDAEGNAVSLTTSIGPSFGARVATPELGFLYAHSYQMRVDPTPRARDETEMTPTILFRGGTPVLVVGAAGSERIPTAILQVISNIVDRKHSLEQALAMPRIFCFGNKLRMQAGFSTEIVGALRERGFEIELGEIDPPWHLGLVHAVQYDPRSGMYFGAADPGYDGSAGGPESLRKPVGHGKTRGSKTVFTRSQNSPSEPVSLGGQGW